MYENQLIRTNWNKIYSEYFKVINRVIQGGKLSPLLFTCYIDELIRRLEFKFVGCYINHKYARVLVHILDTCTTFAQEYQVKFNARKSVSMCMSKNQTMFNVSIGGKPIKCDTVVKHLGQYIAHDLNEHLD